MNFSVKINCKMCKKNYEVLCKKEDYDAWKMGKRYIQDILSYLSPDDRELLISQICGKCFDNLFPGDDMEDNMKISKLIQYMKSRAEFEKTEWGLEDDMIASLFDSGIRNFFGVKVDDDGELIEDSQQPSFFSSYKFHSIN